MREVRPTIRALKDLPRETFDDTTPLDLIANGAFKTLNLYGVQHPLLDDARKRFANGLPDVHREGTKVFGQPVYEVRDHQGAGWRGAVVLDGDGDPWLVWVEKHNRFHHRIKAVAKKFTSMLPTPAEYKIRDREEAAQGTLRWKREVLKVFIEALREAVETKTLVRATVSGSRSGESAIIEVEADHDEPSVDVAAAQDGLSLLTVGMRVRSGGWRDFERALLEVCLPFLQPDPERVEQAYGKDDSMIVYADITHAQLIQLLADPPPYEAMEPVAIRSPDRLHYVGIDYLIDGYVNGNAVRGVCGVWFVATRDESAGLPVCDRCEAERPAAQHVLELLRSAT